MITISFSRDQIDYLKSALSGITDGVAKRLIDHIDSELNNVRIAPVDNSNSALGRNFWSVERPHK